MRNWDYRYCWVRDATLTLQALIARGLPRRGARLARLAAARGGRLAAGAADHVRAGGRAAADRARARLAARLRGLAPVRIGNAASRQFQLDVFGELMDALAQARDAGLHPTPPPGGCRRRCSATSRRSGRSPTRASGRCAAAGATSCTPRSWPGSRSTAPSRPSSATATTARSTAGGRCATRSTARCANAATTRSATRSPSPTARGRSTPRTLMIPLVGFLPPDDPRVAGTVEAIQRELMADGFVLRYDSRRGRRRPAARRGRVPAVLVLAGRLPDAARPPRRGPRAVRAARRARQRRRPAGGGVRPAPPPPGRELPAGVHPRRARQHRAEPRARVGGRTGPAACRDLGGT